MPCAVLSSTLPAEGPTKCILIAIYITAHTDVYQSKQSKHWRLPASLIISERVTRSIQSASQLASHRDLNRAKHVDSNLDDFHTHNICSRDHIKWPFGKTNGQK